MQYDKALSLLAKQLAAGQEDMALITFRAIVDTSSQSFDAAQVSRFNEIMEANKASMFVQFIEADCIMRGFCRDKDRPGAQARIEALADQGQVDAILDLALRHVIHPEKYQDSKVMDLTRLKPLVALENPWAVYLDTWLNNKPGVDLLLFRSPGLAVHNMIRRKESAFKRLMKLVERKVAKIEALKKKMA